MAALSQSGFNFLKNKEGYRTVPYKLQGEKYYTVGLGHYGPDVIPGKEYNYTEIMSLFNKDSLRFTSDVMKIWDSSMTQNMFDAMFSFAYNHGNISNTKLGQAIKNGGWKNKEEIIRIWTSSYCSGRHASTLKKRRQAEVNLFYSNAEFDYNEQVYGSSFAGYRDDEYTSIYSEPGENITNFSTEGITTNMDLPQDEHTRIYKATESTIVLDELSLPMNQGGLDEENT